MSGKPNDKMFKTMVEKLGGEKEARDWFRGIGRTGGKNGTTGGFWHAKYVKYDVEFVREQGKKGGLKGKKG